MKEYDVYIRFPEKIQDGQEIGMILRDQENLRHFPARVRVYRSAEKHPDQAPLHVLTPLGLQYGKTWAVEVLETLEEGALMDPALQLCTEFKGGV